MNKCFVTKLIGNVNNPSLPILPIIELRNYLTTGVNGQTIDITNDDIPSLGNVQYKDLKVEIDCLIEDTASTQQTFFELRGNVLKTQRFNTDSLRVTTSSNIDMSYVPGELLHLEISTTKGTVKLNGTTYSGNALTSTSFINSFKIFYLNTVVGEIKIKEIKLTRESDNLLLFDAVPALFNGSPCLYDTLSEKAFFADSGDLVAE